MSEVKPLIATPEMLDGMRNGRQVRWYVLSLPSCHRGPACGLQEELDRRLALAE